MEDENPIINAENYRASDEGLTFRIICMKQLQLVVHNKSREMRIGFWIYTQNPNMATQKLRYVGDSREEYSQSLDTLYDLLIPKFDKKMKEDFKKTNEEIEKWQKAYEEKRKKEKISYWNTALPIYRTMFVNLCLFLERYGWLESGGVEED